MIWQVPALQCSQDAAWRRLITSQLEARKEVSPAWRVRQTAWSHCCDGENAVDPTCTYCMTVAVGRFVGYTCTSIVACVEVIHKISFRFLRSYPDVVL